MALKSQDVYMVLKIVSAGSRRPYSQLASELVMSPSEAHACVKRAQASHLLHGPALHNRPNVAALEEYAAFGDRLRGLGFAEDTSEGAPLCRWVRQETILDVMPLDEKILGFSNRWCRAAMETAVKRRLSDELEIRLVTALFLSPPSSKRDLEDLVFVVDGRATLVSEVRAETAELRAYVRAEINTLLTTAGFLDALPGFLLPDAVSQSRISIVLQRLEDLASLKLGANEQEPDSIWTPFAWSFRAPRRGRRARPRCLHVPACGIPGAL